VAALVAVTIATAAVALPALTTRLTLQPGAPVAGTAVLGPAPAAAIAPRATPSSHPSPSPQPDPEPPPPDDTADAAVDEITALEDEVTVLVNRERDEAGCGAVTTDERLRTAARGHSRDMATNDYFDHTAPDGSSFVDRAARADYPRDAAAGENIAYGYRTPADVMDGWMNSDGHRRNLLTCSHRTIGVGLAYDRGGRAYWTQVFGRS
jgi:uncharacterized protein YkwD